VEWAPCKSELLHVRDCEVHDRCTRGPSRIHSCQGCPDYGAPACTEAGDTRHLLYHVYPVRGTGTWQRNLDRLIPRLGLFNGRRVVAVMTQEPDATVFLDPPEAVEEYLRGQQCEFLWLENVPGGPGMPRRLSREAASFVPLWDRVSDLTGPEHVAFYAHAKGVGRPFDPGTTVHQWASLLYETNLDYWPLVRSLLQRHPLAGSLKKVGTGMFGANCTWHYSGTFFWARNADVFARDWRRVDRTWWGAESWVGVHFRPEEGGCLFLDGAESSIDAYRWSYMQGTIQPRLREWRSRHTNDRTPIASLTTSSTR
jgi:hypothetical protein